MLKRGALLVILVLSCASVALADTAHSAKAWLEKMSQALHSLNYRISFVQLQENGDFEPYLWRHAVVDGVEMEHLSLQNGPGREVVRIGDRVSYFEPNVPAYSLRSQVINGPLPAEMLRDPTIIQQGYDLVTVGRSRISGRPAQQLRIVSKDKSRYGFNLWLDQQTGLLLRMDMMDPQGRALEQIQVTSLQVSAEPDEYFTRIETAKLPDVIERDVNSGTINRWQINWLPAGMQVVRRDTHQLPLTGALVDYIMLSDGLIDVSVYLQKIQSGSGDDGWLRHSGDTLLSIQQGPLEVTVVGKLPPKTAKAIAESVSLNTAAVSARP
ncbi:Sigma-E factor regulatory protein [Saliniradius amylolyticus]|uniref:Sigma-E factor regulatory protein n=1 Tax=Saliniradius amylolyticus TaxID=2183582 RepID=A0A2S2E175_9ALTE|nr:MucB/RseB C-terminal domain-containing protein [Saliniradius amylolyticus]AWL11398.1 Sigma-E factor regulatory protein [Saliniradius amylolyticus]